MTDAWQDGTDDQKDACNWEKWEGSCAPVLRTKIISIIWGVLSVGYFVVYVFYNTRARVRLEKLPYNRFRTGNLLQNWQVRFVILLYVNHILRPGWWGQYTEHRAPADCLLPAICRVPKG